MMNAIKNVLTVSLTVIFASAAGKIVFDISKDIYSGVRTVWGKAGSMFGKFSFSRSLGK